MLVGNASLDGIESVEHIALHHDQLGDAVHHDRILQGYEVDPATTALTACDCSILMTQVADGLARLIEQLRGERTSADTGAVSLHDTKDIADLIRTDAKTRASAGTDGIRRGDEGIAAEVDIEHRTLSTLAKHALAALQDVVDLMF